MPIITIFYDNLNYCDNIIYYLPDYDGIDGSHWRWVGGGGEIHGMVCYAVGREPDDVYRGRMSDRPAGSAANAKAPAI